MRKLTVQIARISAFLLILILAAAAAVRKGPYLIFGGDPSQMTVLWQLDAVQNCTIRWGLTTDYALGSAIVPSYGDVQYKYAISGLLPETLYYYQVDGVGTGSFRTAPDGTAANVKLVAYSDPQGYPSGHDATCAAIIGLFARDPSFQTLAICAGDRSDEDTEKIWAEQYFAPGWGNILYYLARVPVAGPRGNHERDGIVFKKYYPYPYVNDFYWSFDYGPVHIVVVDEFISYAPGSPQHEWLVNDLSATSKSWKIITFHMPGWSADNVHENEVDIQRYIQPLCLQYGIDLVISGHNHYYSRADVSGVQHLTTGGASDYYSQPMEGEYIVKSEGAFHYLEIDIQGREALVTARRREGAVIETFTISHGASVRITSPQNGATLLVGQATNVQARVLPTGGACTEVDFYANEQLIGTDAEEPYEVAWTPTLSPSTVSLVAKAFIEYEGSMETIASAPVNVNISDTPPPQGLNIRVSQGSDDAEESASGGMNLGSSDLELVYDGFNQKVGMRFNSIAVPRGAIITNAYVQFKVDEANSESTFLTIQGENSDQAATFSSRKTDISSRARTTAAVPWNPNPWAAIGAAGADQQTPNISSVIQEIINRPGWTSGNSLALIITGTGHRTAVAYDGEAAGAPLLHVEYSDTVPGNHAPVAIPDSYTINEDTALPVEAPGVLGNDTDQDGNTLTAGLTAGPTHGTLALNSNGGFTYTPSANYTGADSFTYNANDGMVDSNVATVAISIIAMNDPPVANPQSVTVPKNTPKAITLTGSDVDGDSLIFSIVSGPGHGSLSGTAPNLTYTPASNYSGPDSFTFKVNDGKVDSDAAMVSITVTAVNQAPVVNAGTDQTIILPNKAQLSGSASDDGLPSSVLTVTWRKVSGPGNVTFADTSNPSTSAAFSKAGTYTLRLTATDGELSSSDDVTVTVKKK